MRYERRAFAKLQTPAVLLPPRARESGRAAPPSEREARGETLCSDEEASGQQMEILVQGTSPERTERMV